VEADQKHPHHCGLPKRPQGQDSSVQITEIHKHQQKREQFQGGDILQQDRQQRETRLISNMPYVFRLLEHHPQYYPPNINNIIGSKMHYLPKATSPLNSASLVLKNSRVSDRSTEADRSFKVNRSFDLESTFIDSPANRLSAISFTHAHPSRIAEELPVQTHSSEEQIRKNFVTKVLIRRMLAVRAALKKMHSLPIKIFKKSGSFDLARLIVVRTKPNIETSILRTLLFA
jgi:hypothetical protein